ncbi:MAG: formate dehydrogenase accessory sulfurtransferase FdhD [Myxococcota bacterium]
MTSMGGDRRTLHDRIVDRSVTRIGGGDTRLDAVVVEEPLEIRVAGEPLAVTMRTPGDDHHLAVGFLFAEGVIAGFGDVGGVAHCGRPGEEGFGNVVDVTPAPGLVLDPDALLQSRRGSLTTAACGLCGRRTIADLLARLGPVPADPRLPLDLLRDSTDRLRQWQPAFQRTGGLHAAAVLALDGAPLAVAEDVGRHNAVDKVIGALLYERVVGAGTRLDVQRPAVLAISGRTSFEMVQKAAAAGVGAVASVSAPTSLAVDLADALGLVLAGFVRGGHLNLYSHAERVTDRGP